MFVLLIVTVLALWLWSVVQAFCAGVQAGAKRTESEIETE